MPPIDAARRAAAIRRQNHAIRTVFPIEPFEYVIEMIYGELMVPSDGRLDLDQEPAGVADLVPFRPFGGMRALQIHDIVPKNETHARTASLHNLAADRDEKLFDIRPIDGRRRWLRENRPTRLGLLAVHDCIRSLLSENASASTHYRK